VAGDNNEASQTVKAQLRLRELIVGGELVPGERVPELALVERLGVSRTPVRTALQKLQDEGLLDALPGGGYAVKAFGEAEIRDAIEVRGTMEGLAARLAAERGVPRSMLAQARELLAGIDALLAAPALDEAAFSEYVEHNGRFHALLAEMAGSEVVRRQVERAAALPFASPNGFVLVRSTGAQARDVLVVAQEQHRAVLDAIEAREGARAENLMREHARIAHRNLNEALVNRQAMQRLPGSALIRRGR
jgi:GntR family transcriptional regulator of vanillate catabolism